MLWEINTCMGNFGLVGERDELGDRNLATYTFNESAVIVYFY